MGPNYWNGEFDGLIRFEVPSGKSQGLRSGEQGGQVVGNTRLITLPLVKCCRRNCCTQNPMCGGASPSIKVIESTY